MRLPIFCASSAISMKLVLASVAVQPASRGRYYDYGMQLRFRPCFQPKVELLSVRNHLFHDGTHLVHLNGIDDEVLAFIPIHVGGLLETAGYFLSMRLSRMSGKTNQHGAATQLQLVHQFLSNRRQRRPCAVSPPHAFVKAMPKKCPNLLCCTALPNLQYAIFSSASPICLLF